MTEVGMGQTAGITGWHTGTSGQKTDVPGCFFESQKGASKTVKLAELLELRPFLLGRISQGAGVGRWGLSITRFRYTYPCFDNVTHWLLDLW